MVAGAIYDDVLVRDGLSRAGVAGQAFWLAEHGRRSLCQVRVVRDWSAVGEESHGRRSVTGWASGR